MSGSTRRSFIQGGAAATAALSGGWPTVMRGSDDRMVRLGFIGMGGRGTHLLKLTLARNDTQVNAVCDLRAESANRAAALVRESGRDDPGVYAGEDDAFRKLLARDDLDAVVVATPWRWHTPMSVAAMKAGKAVAVEVPAAVTLQECWDLVNTSEATKKPCMMLENVCYRRDVMAALKMVRDGLFGELIHCQCGYQHDLRAVKFNPGAKFGPGSRGEANWRTQHSIQRNGDVYPTHGAGPMANCLDIDRGNRFVTLTSTATKARGLHDYVVRQGGADHPNAKIQWALGDVVTSVIKCARGETLLVSHDTNLPRPYSLNFRVQGTRGIWMSDNKSIYIEDLSPKSHRWEPFEKYQKEHDHPLWKRFGEEAAGSGHGGMDFFVINGFVEALKRGRPTPIDVYESASWSAIGPLSERSIARGSAPVFFPDFTRGQWVVSEPTFGLNDQF